jgi:hypothetical protein
MSGRAVTLEEYNEIKRMHARGYRPSRIAFSLGRNITTVQDHIRNIDNGVPFRQYQPPKKMSAEAEVEIARLRDLGHGLRCISIRVGFCTGAVTRVLGKKSGKLHCDCKLPSTRIAEPVDPANQWTRARKLAAIRFFEAGEYEEKITQILNRDYPGSKLKLEDVVHLAESYFAGTAA